jgi:outer membrane receptor protein involved in Fe transport
LRFSASAGRSFRAPTIEEANLNAALDPEKAWTYEAGFEIYRSSESFQINFFHADVGDLIQTSSSSAMNIGTAQRHGMEIQLHQVINNFFRDSWDYTYLKNQGVPAGFNQPVELALSPRHTVNYTATIIPRKRWSVDATMRYETTLYSGNDKTGDKMYPQFVADIRLAYQWRQLEAFLGIKDLFNKRYVEVPGYPLPGRNVYAGIRLRLWG